MEKILLSNNGRYLLHEEKVYDVFEKTTHLISEISLLKWLDILNENTIFSVKHSLTGIKELYSYHRKSTFQLIESLPYDLKVNMMFEYEYKFGSKLITENYFLLENWFSDAWSWTKEKLVKGAEGLGGYAVAVGNNFIKCVTSGECSPLFENFREMLYSPVGISIETFLSVTGIGKVIPALSWGFMALYDTYLLLSGSNNFSWLNLIFDLLGVGLGSVAKGFRSIFGGSAGVAKTAGKGLGEVISSSLKNPKTAGAIKKLSTLLSGGATNVINTLKKSAKFLSDKLGITWVNNIVNKLSGVISKILEAIGIKATTKKSLETGLSRSELTKRGVSSSIKQGGVATGFEKISNPRTTSDPSEKIINTIATMGPIDYVPGVDY